MPDYLKKYGHRVLKNGYEPVPIKPGTKAPEGIDYSHKRLPEITHKHVDRWAANGFAHGGIGIRARHTPLYDIDCQWQEEIDACIKDAEELIGFAVLRYGAAPKVGIPYRSEVPFSKIQSKAFKDPNGKKAQVEFLGDGQQWVAHAIHPDTKKPYKWPYEKMNPIQMRRDELDIVRKEAAEECCRRFEERCIGRGWERWKSKSQSTAVTTYGSNHDPDDITGSVPLGLSIEEVRRWLEKLPNDESVEYEDNYNLNPDTPNYRNVIFAVWHETEGSEEGHDAVLEWSEKSSKHEQEEGRFEKLWGSADHEDRDNPVTFRYIIKCVQVREETEKRERFEEYLQSLDDVDDRYDLKELIEKIAGTRFDPLDLNQLANAVKAANTRINRVTLPIGEVKKMLYHKPTEDDLPAWVKPWVYVQHSNRFFNPTTGMELEPKAFDSTFSRYLGGASAVDFALNKAEIKVYYTQMYNPAAEETFWFEGHERINYFSDRLMPKLPGKLSKTENAAVNTVEAHIRHMLASKRERALFTSWLAYIVQTNDRPNWAVVLKGVEGDGKSFFAELMSSVFGSTNVRMLDATQLEDKYTGWAVGQLFCFIEELRIQGHSRYEIVNKIKPFISNTAINVHRKNIDPFTALNTTAYMAATNFPDAVPINDNDRRWFVLYSRWQTGEQIRQFRNENPGYFDKLFAAARQHSGALRQWLMNYELHPEFDPKGIAPLTRARQQMIDLSKSDTQKALDDALEDDDQPRIGREMIVASDLIKYLFDATEEMVKTGAVTKLLTNNGYTALPHRLRMESGSDNKDTIWVRNPKLIPVKNQSVQRAGVLKFLAARQRKINHNDEI